MNEARSLDLAERAPIYAWLSRLLVQEVEQSDWAELRTEGIRSILARIEPDLGDALESPMSSAQQQALEEEFARLFLLPGGVSPFASSWLGEGEEHAAIRESISNVVENGLVALGRARIEREPWGRLPADHVSILLDLVAQAQASDQADARELATRLDRELLRPFLARFGQALAKQAETPLYSALGSLIAALEATDESIG